MDEENPITMKSAWLYKDGEPLGEIKDVETVSITDESYQANQSKIDSLFIDDWNDIAQSFQINIKKISKGILNLLKKLEEKKEKLKRIKKKNVMSKVDG